MLSDLKQHTFIILKFWWSEVQKWSHWAKIKVLAGLHFVMQDLGESFFTFSSLLRFPALLVCWPHPCSKLPMLSLFQKAISLPPSSPFKDPYDYTRPTWINQDAFFIGTDWQSQFHLQL